MLIYTTMIQNKIWENNVHTEESTKVNVYLGWEQETDDICY